MIVPIANAIFEDNFDIKNFYNQSKREVFENLEFRKVNKIIFPIYKIKNRITELPSTPIIINASNEVLVAHFLKKKIPFQAIFKIIMTILDDRNYKKYAIRKPKNINQINKIDFWAKQKTKEKITALYD
jgi:1-deoxy-D-xylulose 5-phosphate reductoisomerase